MSNPIDLPLAIAEINPQAEYVLDQSVPPHSVVEWRGPGAQPTSAELYAAWLRCTRFEVDAQHAIDRGRVMGEVEAGTGDLVTVTVLSGENEGSIAVLVRDERLVVGLVGGVGQLGISASMVSVAPHVLVRAEDQAVYGDHRVVVKAV